MTSLDWTQFTKRIDIKASKDKIFGAWNSQEEIEKWFLRQAQFFDEDDNPISRLSSLTPGSRYEWLWHGSDYLAKGEVLKNNESDFLSFSFMGAVVEVFVKTEGEHNILELIQKDINADDDQGKNGYIECVRGWTFYVANLKSYLEGGIDLRNRDFSLQNLINV